MANPKWTEATEVKEYTHTFKDGTPALVARVGDTAYMLGDGYEIPRALHREVILAMLRVTVRQLEAQETDLVPSHMV